MHYVYRRRRNYGGRGISRVLSWDGNSTGLPAQWCFIGSYEVRLPFTPLLQQTTSLTAATAKLKRSHIPNWKFFLKPVARSPGAAAFDANFAVVYSICSSIFYLQCLYLTNKVAPDFLFFKANYINRLHRQRLCLYIMYFYKKYIHSIYIKFLSFSF